MKKLPAMTAIATKALEAIRGAKRKGAPLSVDEALSAACSDGGMTRAELDLVARCIAGGIANKCGLGGLPTDAHYSFLVLAVMFQRGMGGPNSDPSAAKTWFGLSAEMGSSSAKEQLEKMLKNGLMGVDVSR